MLRVRGLEIVNKAGIKSHTTSNTGAAWIQLTATECKQVILYNNTGGELEASYCSAAGVIPAGDNTLVIPDGVAQPFRGITNAQQIRVRVNGGADNAAVTFKWIYEAA